MNIIKQIQKYNKIRKLKKQIKQSSFNLESLEMAGTEEWERLNLAPKYKAERAKLRNLRLKLKSLC